MAALFQWSILNDLPFNIRKCSFISFTRSSTYLDFNYDIFGKILSRVNVIKDLGIFRDTDLKFDDHLDMVISKAHGFLMKNCKDIYNKNTLLHLYKTLMVSQLTYCSQIWSPYKLNRIKVLESSQHRFVRHFFFNFGTPMDWFDQNFQLKLEELSLPTISYLHTVLSNKVVFKSINVLNT